ncbi:hypothetical protein CQA53_04380 [Helicobacter didelphidarum]|uniref:Cytochrome c assembly protein domain-containing protein n=2 Tax=Helicobacter didelphidarum TaxID=2040648 RepID=A0A3D8IM05_9HELI|nr:hypothetical protein CQA53_04380 [Helicobacter didelphidarum]
MGQDIINLSKEFLVNSHVFTNIDKTNMTQSNTEKFIISPNQVLDYKGYRLFQSTYDKDYKGTFLLVNKDPGKIPTYIGYALLIAGFLGIIFSKKGRIAYLKKQLYRYTPVVLIFLLCISSSSHILHANKFSLQENPTQMADIQNLSIPYDTPRQILHDFSRTKNHADNFAKLLVADSNRVMPLDTLALNIISKITNKHKLKEPLFLSRTQSYSIQNPKTPTIQENNFIQDLRNVTQNFPKDSDNVEQNTITTKHIKRQTSFQQTYKIPYALNYNQIFLGMLFFPEIFQNLQIIPIKHQLLRKILDMHHNQESITFNDLFKNNEYKLEQYVLKSSNTLAQNRTIFDKEVLEVHEKMNILYMVYTLNILRIFPYNKSMNNNIINQIPMQDSKQHISTHKQIYWLSPRNEVEFDKQTLDNIQSLLGIYIVSFYNAMQTNDWHEANKNLENIQIFQQQSIRTLMQDSQDTTINHDESRINFLTQDSYQQEAMHTFSASTNHIPSKWEVNLEILLNHTHIFQNLILAYLLISCSFFLIAIKELFFHRPRKPPLIHSILTKKQEEISLNISNQSDSNATIKYGFHDKQSVIRKIITIFLQLPYIQILYGCFIFCVMLHTLGLIARWLISNHAPFSNGYESMVYIAWVGAIMPLLLTSQIFWKKLKPIKNMQMTQNISINKQTSNFIQNNIVESYFIIAASSVLCGIALFVAHLGFMNPQIGVLPPALQSYWLNIHVATIIASYGFLGLCCILGIISLLLSLSVFYQQKILEKTSKLMNLHKENICNKISSYTLQIIRVKNFKHNAKNLCYMNEISMIVGLCLLSIGNIFGAIWANENWGRYWGWDSKETWTLISILVYAVVLHMRFIKGLDRHTIFAFGSIIAFGAILMSYFGVNFYFTGLHSYISN